MENYDLERRRRHTKNFHPIQENPFIIIYSRGREEKDPRKTQGFTGEQKGEGEGQATARNHSSIAKSGADRDGNFC